MTTKDWITCTVADIASKSKNAIAMGPFGSRIKTENFVEVGIPVIRGVNISQGRFYPYDFVYLTESKANELSSANAFPGDLVFTHRGTLGQVGLIPEGLFDRYVVSQSQMKLTCDTEKVSPLFLFYYFQSKGKAELLKHVGGSGVPAISSPSTTLRNLSITIPLLPEQNKIAAILSAYDDLIENNQRRIKLLEQAARDLYQEWFVHFRFPGHEQVEMVESELGRIPDGWTVDSVKAVADVNALSLRNSHELEKIRYVDISSVSTGQIDEVRELPFSDAPGRARRIVRHGDIIWSMVRPNRQSYALILHPEDDLIVSTGFAVVSPIKLPFSYVYHVLTTDAFVGYLVNHARGAAYPAVTGEDFENARVVIPAEVIAEKFHHIVIPMYEQRETLIRKNVLLSQSRDLLLPRLISGDIDVMQVSTGGIE